MSLAAHKLPVVSDELPETRAHEHFRCEQLRCTLTRLACARRFARASVVRGRGRNVPRSWWVLLDVCGCCSVGQAHQHRLQVYAPEHPKREAWVVRYGRGPARISSPGSRTAWWRVFPHGAETGSSLLEAYYRGQALDIPIEAGPSTTPQGAFWLMLPDIPERCFRLSDLFREHWQEHAEHIRQRREAARKAREVREAREAYERRVHSRQGRVDAKHLAIQIAAKRQGLSLLAYLARRPATVEWLRHNPPPADMIREDPQGFWLLLLPKGDENDEST